MLKIKLDYIKFKIFCFFTCLKFYIRNNKCCKLFKQCEDSCKNGKDIELFWKMNKPTWMMDCDYFLLKRIMIINDDDINKCGIVSIKILWNLKFYKCGFFKHFNDILDYITNGSSLLILPSNNIIHNNILIKFYNILSDCKENNIDIDNIC